MGPRQAATSAGSSRRAHGQLGRRGVLGKQFVHQQPDSDQKDQMDGVPTDVDRLGDEPGDDQHPNGDPAHAMAGRDAHKMQASARILFMQDHLRSAAGGEPCSEDSLSTPETPTPSSPETFVITWRSSPAQSMYSNSRTTTSSCRSRRTPASMTSSSCNRWSGPRSATRSWSS